MNYSAPAGSRWKLAPGSLTSGGDHLYSKRLASEGGHLCTNGSPVEAATSAPTARQRRRPPLHRWLAGDGGHLSACEEVLAPVLLWG
jgi:hypothetical protein